MTTNVFFCIFYTKVLTCTYLIPQDSIQIYSILSLQFLTNAWFRLKVKRDVIRVSQLTFFTGRNTFNHWLNWGCIFITDINFKLDYHMYLFIGLEFEWYLLAGPKICVSVRQKPVLFTVCLCLVALSRSRIFLNFYFHFFRLHKSPQQNRNILRTFKTSDKNNF